MGRPSEPGSNTETTDIVLEKLLEHIANEFERAYVDTRPVPHSKSEMMMLFYKSWSIGMAKYADELGVNLT